MKAITVKQPWASLIVEGLKDIENRTWKCPQKYIGKRVLIHAGNTILRPQECNFTDVQWGNIYGDMRYNILHNDLSTGAIIGSVEIVNCTINYPSIWAERTEGSMCGHIFYHKPEDKVIWNWILANPIKFPEPIPCKGKLSFWEYEGELPEKY